MRASNEEQGELLKQIGRFLVGNHPRITTGSCPYLPHRSWRLLLCTLPANDTTYQEMLDARFRRWGNTAYRPICVSCQECRPIRLPVDEFRPNRSQRRCLERNRDIVVSLGPPEPTPEKLGLHNRYVRERFGEVNSFPSLSSYADYYGASNVSTSEMRYYLENELVGVGIIDVMPEAVSAVYTFYDPDCLDRGIGTWSILRQIELCRELDKGWLYLGYYIADCPRMNYKVNFRPYELWQPGGGWERFEE